MTFKETANFNAAELDHIGFFLGDIKVKIHAKSEEAPTKTQNLNSVHFKNIRGKSILELFNKLYPN